MSPLPSGYVLFGMNSRDVRHSYLEVNLKTIQSSSIHFSSESRAENHLCAKCHLEMLETQGWTGHPSSPRLCGLVEDPCT